MVQLKMEITLGKMACKLLILWMIAWTPYAVMNLWMMFFSPNGITAVFGLIPTICTKCSAAGNAALYGIRYVLVISNSLLGAMKLLFNCSYVNSLGSSYASRNVVLDCQNSKQKWNLWPELYCRVGLLNTCLKVTGFQICHSMCCHIAQTIFSNRVEAAKTRIQTRLLPAYSTIP